MTETRPPEPPPDAEELVVVSPAVSVGALVAPLEAPTVPVALLEPKPPRLLLPEVLPLLVDP